MTLSELLGELLLLFHVFLFVIWLGFELVVFALSLSLRQRDLPMVVRLDRAYLANTIDLFVVVAYLLVIPSGLILAYQRGWWPIWGIPWLMAKLIVFGFIIIVATVLAMGHSDSKQILEQIAAGNGDHESLESQLRNRINGLAPWAIAIQISILLAAFVALAPRSWW